MIKKKHNESIENNRQGYFQKPWFSWEFEKTWLKNVENNNAIKIPKEKTKKLFIFLFLEETIELDSYSKLSFKPKNIPIDNLANTNIAKFREFAK